MATTISQMAAAATPSGNEILHAEQGGGAVKMTADAVRGLAADGLSLALQRGVWRITFASGALLFQNSPDAGATWNTVHTINAS